MTAFKVDKCGCWGKNKTAGTQILCSDRSTSDCLKDSEIISNDVVSAELGKLPRIGLQEFQHAIRQLPLIVTHTIFHIYLLAACADLMHKRA
jgi:hypothetical protein